MKSLNSFAISLCAVSIFIGALYIILPSGSMSKPVKYVLSLAFLLSLTALGGITVAPAELELSDYDTDYTSAYYDSQTASAKYVYEYILQKANIDFSEITVCTDKTENGSISIIKVTVKSSATKEEIIAVLEGVAENVEVEVINE